MTVTPTRPVQPARTPEQRRLEAELLLGERVTSPLELATADPTLINGGSSIPAERWRSIGAVPLRQEGTTMVVAVPTAWSDDQRQSLLRELGQAGRSCRFQPALPEDLNQVLAPAPAVAASPPGSSRSLVDGLDLPEDSLLVAVEEPDDLEMSAGSVNTSPVVSLVDRILIEGLQSGASDIHVEPQESCLEVRFRLDGVLNKVLDDLPKSLTPAVTSRLKIMADLDIAERRLPQDGRIRRIFRGRKMDFRVSTLPSRHGEKVVLRLLDSGATQLGLDSLITDPQARASLRAMGARPYGMVLVTGPTGSGKSTTLYALLAERNDPSINISTVEDPIEYSLKGITQTQVNRDKGYDFSSALRAFMRQDPDVLLVGETRDIETAKTAIEAALTGHLVLTTLHCNDAMSAFARLGEMGVEPFLVSASLLGVVSQRLVRRLCIHCRVPYKPDSEDLARFGLLASREANITFYRALNTGPQPQSCPHCNGNGYKGRIGVFEILPMNETLAAAVAKGATTDVIRRLALESGMKTLLGYGLDLVREGHTTLEEVERMLLTDAGLELERRSRSLHTLSCRSCGGGLQDDWLECPYCLTTRE